MERTTSFGYWLRRRRKALDLTQEELARQVGCAVGTIKKLEGDDRRPSRQMAERLAGLLQIAPEERAAFLKAARAELATDQLEVATTPLETSETSTPAAFASLPSGTVTFLFTDIEDSTRLWSQQPDAMPAALARHDTLLREAIEGHGGVVFKTVGDAFHAAFGTPTDALDAALAAQRALQTERWDRFLEPDAAQSTIRVRMGLHTGTAEVRDGDYFGHTLNRVARIMAAGHGGQILFSAATWELLRDHLPRDVVLRDLGARWLKGLPRPEQIFQLVAADLTSDFPPIITLERPTTNLPAQTTAFIGREREVAAVRDLLRRADARLVTLTGPGGTGKTRLSIQVATALLVSDSPSLVPQREMPALPLVGLGNRVGSPEQGRNVEAQPGGESLFSNGVWFVNLAPISSPDLVASAIAQTLDVRETAGQPIHDLLKDYLREKRMLLLLDNFEQIVEAAPVIGELLATAPGLKVLVTSRMPLRLSGEREYAVPPLALPPPLERSNVPTFKRSNVQTLTQYEAVRLFIERAQAVKLDFAVTNENAPALAEICYRLDGLPLAIELAAARTKLFPLQALLARLADRLKFLTGGARDLPARQQTIRNTIDWSYNLLDAAEQTLFARLGVFIGGCTLEAAEAVCNADGNLPIEVVDGIAALLDKSLLRQAEDPGDEPRFSMLETIREYALEKLEASGEAEALRRQHATYYLGLAETAEPHLQGPGQATWLDRLETAHDNLRSALAWSLGAAGNADVELRLVAALWRFWQAHNHHSEGRRWLAMVLSNSANASTPARVRALIGASILAYIQDEHGQAYALGEEALALARTLGDRRGAAAALILLARAAETQLDNERAFSLGEQSVALSRELGDQAGIADALHIMAVVSWRQGNYALATTLWGEALAIDRALGDTGGIAWVLVCLGNVAVDQGDYEPAAAQLEESRGLFQQLGQKHGIASTNRHLGRIALAHGEYERASALAQQSEQLFREVGDNEGIMLAHHLSGVVSYRQGDATRAAALFADTLARWRELGYKDLVPGSLDALGSVAVAQGRPKRAARLFGAAQALREALSVHMPLPERADCDRARATARAQLGEGAFAAAWEAGRALTLDQAIAEALGEAA